MSKIIPKKDTQILNILYFQTFTYKPRKNLHDLRIGNSIIPRFLALFLHLVVRVFVLLLLLLLL